MRAFVVLIATAALALAAVVGPLVFAYREPPAAVVQELQGEREPDLVYKQGTVTMILRDAPCRFKALGDRLEEEGVPPARVYLMTSEGRTQARGCWVRSAFDDEALVEDLNGEATFMPLSWFKPDPGV
jgi:hypothetical protein